MTDTTIVDERNFIITIARMLGHSRPANAAPHMSCTWSRNPETGRIESHWVAQSSR